MVFWLGKKALSKHCFVLLLSDTYRHNKKDLLVAVCFSSSVFQLMPKQTAVSSKNTVI